MPFFSFLQRNKKEFIPVTDCQEIYENLKSFFIVTFLENKNF